MNNSEYDAKLRQLLEEHPSTAGKILKSQKMKVLHDYVMSNTSFLQDENLTTRIFLRYSPSSEKSMLLDMWKAT